MEKFIKIKHASHEANPLANLLGLEIDPVSRIPGGLDFVCEREDIIDHKSFPGQPNTYKDDRQI